MTRERSMSGGEGRRTPVLLAVLLLVLQSFIPAAAVAHDHARGRIVEICTPEGLKQLRLPAAHGHDHGFGGLACEQCVIASLVAPGAAVPPPIPTMTRIEPLRLSATAQSLRLGTAYMRPPSRGPPVRA